MKKIVVVCMTLIALAGLNSCGQFTRIRGNGNLTRDTRSLDHFKGVSLSGSMNVYITKGADFSVVVETDDNLHEFIKTEVHGNTLSIGTVNNTWISPSEKVKVYVTMPELNKAKVSGSGNIKTEGTFNTTDEFETSVSGSGNCNLSISTPKLHARISGSGNLHIAGESDEVEVSISGSGNFKGIEMETKDAFFRISGSGDAEATVNGNLEARISGSGSIKYKGNASVSARTSGSGRVSRI